jgi:S-adenosylmethionine synthetase
MVVFEALKGPPVAEQAVEIVERKGLGHPDVITDRVVEAVSVALSREYLRRFGTVLHHNIDKGLLVAGRAQKAFGGGRLLRPMELVVGDRATFQAERERVPVREIVVETARQWFLRNLRFVEPERHLKVRVALAPGAAQLVDIFRRGGPPGANDTSCAAAHWPPTDTEQAVLALEQFLNSRAFKARLPETGEDVKVMGLRQGRRLHLVVAMPLLDRFIRSEAQYFALKEMVLQDIVRHFVPRFRDRFEALEVELNALDARGRGLEGIYLSVLGTSAEDADSGQVGRAGRAGGLITPMRPMSLEAPSGKNPVSHVGKLYNVLAQRLARQLYEKVGGMKETQVFILSRIGAPLGRPLMVSVKVMLQRGASLRQIQRRAQPLLEQALQGLPSLGKALATGRLKLFT